MDSRLSKSFARASNLTHQNIGEPFPQSWDLEETQSDFGKLHSTKRKPFKLEQPEIGKIPEEEEELYGDEIPEEFDPLWGLRKAVYPLHVS